MCVPKGSWKGGKKEGIRTVEEEEKTEDRVAGITAGRKGIRLGDNED